MFLAHGATPESVAQYNEEKAEHGEVCRQISELRLAVPRGKLARTEDVLAEWVSRVTIFRGVLLSFPGRLGTAMEAEVRAGACSALLDKAVRQANEALT